MPKRIPVQTIIVHRDGKNFTPKIGEVFDFTAAELDDIKAVNPGAVRKPVNEEPEEVQISVEAQAALDAAAKEKAEAEAKGAGKTSKAAKPAAADAGL